MCKEKMLLLVLSIGVLAGFNVKADQLKVANIDQLLMLDLRELMDVRISLVSRTEEEQFKSPAAVYVISSEDIRRTGHRRLPEILRMVPGLHVAKIDANNWSVSSRNSQTRFSSTMLVMIDGRHVYSPFYAGVYWESQDTFIEDIDRIEVVRGPGGSLWGANAVDGIINIITKSAADTKGAMAYALAGTGEMSRDVGVRFGDSIGKLNYRVFAKGYASDTGEYLDNNVSTNEGYMPPGEKANDEGKAGQAGFRLDWGKDRNTFMIQGGSYNGEFNDDRIVNNARVENQLETKGGYFVFDWGRIINETNSISTTIFYNQISRYDDILENDEAMIDLNFQHDLSLESNELSWGFGYRHYDNSAEITDPANCAVTAPCFGVAPEDEQTSSWNAFVQDRITISDVFSLIVGAKFENNEYTGFEYQPSLHGLYEKDSDTTYWFAITRAVRVPDRVNTDGILDFGTFTTDIGNDDQESFVNVTFEFGHRKRISNTWVFDNTMFYSDYYNTVQDGARGIDSVYGFESYIKHQYTPRLRIEGGYAYHEGSAVLSGGNDETLSRLPNHTVNIRSYYDLQKNMDLDLMIYWVDESKSRLGNLDIPAYTRVDLRYGWRPMKQLDLSVLLTNMLDEAHPEAIDTLMINTGVNRGAMFKLTYTTH